MSEPTNKKLIAFPNLKFWEESYGMTLDECIKYAKQYNVYSTNISEQKGGMTKKAIAEPDVVDAAQIVSNYYLNLTNNPEANKPEDAEKQLAAVNRLAAYFDKGGAEMIYFDHYSTLYQRVISAKPIENGEYVKLPAKDRAIIDKAVALFFEKPENKMDGHVPAD